MGYRLNRLNEPVFIAVSKPLLTEFGIHCRLESCEVLSIGILCRSLSYLHALKYVEVDRVVVCLGRDHPRLVGIPDHNVGIRPGCNDTLARVEVEYFCRGGARHIDEPLLGHDPFVHTPLPDDGHAVLQAVDAVRDLGEIVFAQSLLNAVECAVVSAGALKITWMGQSTKSETTMLNTFKQL